MLRRSARGYINRIDVPVPIDIQEWLLTTPEVAPALHRPVTGYFMQLQIPFDRGATCVVSQAVERVQEGIAGLIFDIDVGQVHEFPVDTDQMWRGLAGLRAIKNEVFFKSITMKTKRLFQ